KGELPGLQRPRRCNGVQRCYARRQLLFSSGPYQHLYWRRILLRLLRPDEFNFVVSRMHRFDAEVVRQGPALIIVVRIAMGQLAKQRMEDLYRMIRYRAGGARLVSALVAACLLTACSSSDEEAAEEAAAAWEADIRIA